MLLRATTNVFVIIGLKFQHLSTFTKLLVGTGESRFKELNQKILSNMKAKRAQNAQNQPVIKKVEEKENKPKKPARRSRFVELELLTVSQQLLLQEPVPEEELNGLQESKEGLSEEKLKLST